MTRTTQTECGPLEFSCMLKKHWGAAAVIALWVAIVAGFVAETGTVHERWVSDPVTITLE